MVKTNSIKAWLLATRPKTLSGALIPIAVATALAATYGKCNWRAVVVCFVFAMLMQVAANFINDLFDYLKGTDREDRLGPERACAQGWITPRAMKFGIAVVIILALATGCIVLLYSSLWLIAVGALCAVFAFLYTTILSYSGMGDLLVLVFFGLVPCCGTFFVATGEITAPCVVASMICGILIDTLLIINNYRDRDTDRQTNKQTLIVLFGEPFGRYFYLGCGIVAWAGCLLFPMVYKMGWGAMLTTLYLPLHYVTWRKMVSIRSGRALNGILGETSRNMLLFGLLLTIGLLL